MSQRQYDDDVDRIAARVVERGGLGNSLSIVLTLLVGPAFIFPALAATQSVASGLPAPVGVVFTAAVIAVPLLAFVLVSSRRAR